MNSIIKMHNLIYALIISTMIIGCSDNKQTEEKTTQVKQASASGIEVVENKDANAIKVQEKAQDKNQSKSYYFDYGIKSAYSEDAKPANSDASVRVKPRTNIDANMNVRSPYEKVQVSLLVSKLSKKFIVKCSACHNDYANGVIGPSLLHKDSEYIFSQIMKFKKDKNLNVLMSNLVENMSETEIKEIADEIYSFNKKINEMRK
ncbi:hypothetical protein FJR48_02865 [Sulfurimonas lithotrophica]|uniref:Cytochrome c domain-containing protein n=1 Tax=Sulfurimonas lithotrophica TaxID=2590022 RepID=A0A5P8NZ68_9BACT|nr:hypothetical protein [Sulfurimonas lithotrophica]QFR48716.1 hypothetical protein FJR48_02865 [Sulfurimonas lithotrophica]